MRPHKTVTSALELFGLRRMTVVVVTAVLAIIVGGGGAYAYFTGNGSGTGTATVGAPVNVTVAAATAANDLFPGLPGTVKFTLKNTNSFTTNFTSVTGATVTSGNPSGCPASNIIVATLPLTISTITVTSGQTTGTQTISTLISMSSTAPNPCQGVAFTVALTLSGQTS
jgi:camelysin-like metallo-endopeptidase